jgi:hypothetical protein
MGEEITLFLKIRSFLLSHNVDCTGTFNKDVETSIRGGGGHKNQFR